MVALNNYQRVEKFFVEHPDSFYTEAQIAKILDINRKTVNVYRGKMQKRGHGFFLKTEMCPNNHFEYHWKYNPAGEMAYMDERQDPVDVETLDYIYSRAASERVQELVTKLKELNTDYWKPEQLQTILGTTNKEARSRLHQLCRTYRSFIKMHYIHDGKVKFLVVPQDNKPKPIKTPLVLSEIVADLNKVFR